MNEIGHVKFRRGLLEHIESGKMKADMLSVYSYLLLKADYNCGIVWHTSAPHIGMKFRKQAKFINRQMMGLEKEGYIKRFGHRGQINAYEVLINSYLVFNGVLINADNSTDINNIAWTCGFNSELTGCYRELKVDLTVFYVSSYKEIKNIRIKEVKEIKNKDNGFSLFWNQYHSITGLAKTDYQAALKKWKTLNKTERQKAIDSVQSYFDTLKDKKYCKKARTYLGDKNFNDEFTKAEDDWQKQREEFING